MLRLEHYTPSLPVLERQNQITSKQMMQLGIKIISYVFLSSQIYLFLFTEGLLGA